MTNIEKITHENACLKADLEQAKAILEQLPPCPVHGHGCKEWALDWISEKKRQRPPNIKIRLSQRIMNFFTNKK